MDQIEEAHVRRVAELDEEQMTVIMALEMRTKVPMSLERVEITG